MTTAGVDRRMALRRWLLGRAPGAGQPRALEPGASPALPDRPRLLVIRPDHVGDVLFVGPALTRLRQAWPSADVTLLVGPWTADLARRLPGVDRVATLRFPWFDRQPKGAPWQPYRRLLQASRALRTTAGWPFDAALILRYDNWWSAWLASLAGIPIRIGHDWPEVRPFLSHVLPAEQCPTHQVAASVALVTAVLGGASGHSRPETDPLRLRHTAADRATAARLLANIAPPGQPGPVAIHPGSGSAIKRWRTGAWCEVIRGLTAPGETIVLTGSAAESALTSAIAASAGRPTLDLSARTDLGSLAAVYARCRLVMGPDSGPLHLALAAGTPTVHLFGPADARRFGPWGPSDRHRVVAADLPCAPCGRLNWPGPLDHPCVRTLNVASVLAAARGAVGS